MYGVAILGCCYCQEVWKRGAVVKDWRDSEIVPIPKKGEAILGGG